MADQAAFDYFFHQADADRDGKISGSEAIQFFKGTNLPQPVLAKIWHAADNGHTGYLSRPEFYNALKLVTVAQSGRELTPEIMKAALVGPASLKIPPPKIQPPAQQPSTPTPTVAPQQPRPQTSPAPPPVNFQQPNTSAPVNPQQPQQQTPRATSLSALQQVYQQPPSQVVQQRPSSAPSIQGQLFSSSTSPRPVPQDAPTPRPSFPEAVPPTLSKQPSGFDSPFGSGGFSASTAAAAAAPPPVKQPQPGMSPQVTPRSMAGGGPQGFRPAAAAAGSWPKMTTLDVQRYSGIFTSVDTDKDGRITGTQARDLFLGWGLPREVLKQIWDLSDQDGDSMLSFREFCTALYFMERFREGRPLPPVLPAGFHFDDRSPQAVSANRIAEAQAALAQHAAGYNLPAWQRDPRMMQPGGMGMPGQAAMQGGVQAQRNARNRSRGPVPDLDKPAQGGNRVLDSKEKMDFYRSKLQEIVLFKKKCDNRLAEITDKAASEKREEELMAKKYEEKYKQSLEVNSHLVSEEASFREIQTLKTELRSAIAEIERGGNPNALLQTRADRISRDLEELEKALVQRGHLLGFQVTGTTPVELPFGWQPGLQENAAEWDENWDKFDDEGYTTVQGIMDEHEPAVPRTTSSIPGWDDGSLFGDSLDYTADSSRPEEHEEVADSPRAESETSSLKSGVDSPMWSPKNQHSKKTILGSSPLSVSADQSFESHEEVSNGDASHIPALASFDQDPSFDGEHFDKPWASAFSTPTDDIWGLQSDSPSSSIQPVRTRTERDSVDLGENDFFGSKDWSHDILGNSSSVPSTPLFKSGSPAAKPSPFFDQDSRRDSFASSQGRASGTFDDSDPFGDTGPFSQKSDRWSTF